MANGGDQEKALRDRLLATFRIEARENIASMTRHLLDLEAAPSGPGAAKTVEAVFREAHSLKGAARAVNLGAMESVCQSMEGVLSRLKRGEMELSGRTIDALMHGLKTLSELQAALEAGGGGSDAPKPSIAPAINAIARVMSPGETSTPSAPASAAPVPSAPAAAPSAPPSSPDALADRPADRPADDMVRVPTARLDAVRLQSEELREERQSAFQLDEDLRRLGRSLADWRKRWGRLGGDLRALQPGAAPRRGADGARALARLGDFLEWSHDFIDSLDRRLADISHVAARNHQALATKLDALLDEARALMMLSASWLLDGLRPLVRNIAQEQGKEVTLTVLGAAIELDRRVLMELRDPFIHLLRNCVDHGLETPREREIAGKPRMGSIVVEVTQAEANRVTFRITDDGRGIDVARVKAAALASGSLAPAQLASLDDGAALNLVFGSGVSTSPIITDISGRGLGLAIVRDRIVALGGTIVLQNTPGRGLSMQFSLPNSRAALRGVVVRAGDGVFVLPGAAVDRVARIDPADVRSVENRETVEVAGVPLALVRLSRVLGLPSRPLEANGAKLPIVVVTGAAGRLAFHVEAISHEQEVIVKGLGPHLGAVEGLLGATVLGTGEVAPVLDPNALVRAAISGAVTLGSALTASGTHREPERKRTILVAEDSITSRSLLRSILEGAGFAVETAVDGAEALMKLRSAPFDLLVSDVDMPRLGGLDLTARIRADKKLADLPVVLVTSLGTREDRERGIEVGANAYIVKASFEQSNLLDVIGQLI